MNGIVISRRIMYSILQGWVDVVHGCFRVSCWRRDRPVSLNDRRLRARRSRVFDRFCFLWTRELNHEQNPWLIVSVGLILAHAPSRPDSSSTNYRTIAALLTPKIPRPSVRRKSPNRRR